MVFCPAHRLRRWRFHCEKMEILRWHSIPWIPPFSWHSHNMPLGYWAILPDLLMFQGAAGFSMVHRLPSFTILNEGLQGRIRFDMIRINFHVLWFFNVFHVVSQLWMVQYFYGEMFTSIAASWKRVWNFQVLDHILSITSPHFLWNLWWFNEIPYFCCWTPTFLMMKSP